MLRGLLGKDRDGAALLAKLLISFLPAAIAGVALHRAIKAALFGPGPVAAALALGGLVMIATAGRLRARLQGSTRTLASITWREAAIIGLAQCLSLWPGTSRAMVTMLAGMMLGLPATAAAEYSFLLALPTLGAATLFDAAKGGQLLAQQVGPVSIVCGFVSAALVAALSVRGLVRYLARRGLAPFGWYRIGLAGLVGMRLFQ